MPINLNSIGETLADNKSQIENSIVRQNIKCYIQSIFGIEQAR